MDGRAGGRDGEVSSVSGYQVSRCFRAGTTVSYFRFPTWVSGVANNSDLDRLIKSFG